jgi:hypothetical protein
MRLTSIKRIAYVRGYEDWGSGVHRFKCLCLKSLDVSPPVRYCVDVVRTVFLQLGEE